MASTLNKVRGETYQICNAIPTYANQHWPSAGHVQ